MPYFSTDTVSAQRALEIKRDAVLMSKNGVDGVYDMDPRLHPEAKKLDTLTFDEALQRGLRVVDQAAFSLCHDNKLPMVVFGMEGEGNITRALQGERIGTLVTPCDGRQYRENADRTEKAATEDDRRDALRGRGEDGEGSRGRQGGLRPASARGEPIPACSPSSPSATTAPPPCSSSSRRSRRRRPGPSSSARSTSPRCTRSRRRCATPTSGVNPSNDGNIIRVVLPILTEERRREYIKLAHHKAEEARVSIRNVRRKAKTDLDRLVKDGEVGEDDGVRGEKELGPHQEIRRHRRRLAQRQGERARGLNGSPRCPCPRAT